jgi:ribosomal protein S12 methylthiotransferase accessory factor
MTMFYYSVPPDMAIIPMNDGSVLFRSDNLAIKLEGESAKYLLEEIFPLMDGKTELSAIAQAKKIDAGELKKHLDSLVASGVLKVKEDTRVAKSTPANSFINFLERLHIDPAKTADYFRQTTIVVAGLEGAGGHVATQLLQAGIGHLTLIDPFPLQKEELVLFPFLKEDSVGQLRQDVFKNYFETLFPDRQILLAPTGPLTKDIVYTVAQEANLIVGCFDKSFVSVHHWLNQVAMDKNIPAVFSEIENHICRIGPVVLPGETACFMCYRMRDIACAENFTEAMSYETYLNNQKQPMLHARGFLPSSLNFMGGIIVNEIIKLLLALEATLSSRVLEFNTLTLEMQKHYVLQKPDCPVCAKKKEWTRTHPSLDALKEDEQPASNIYQYKEVLVSSKTGIIKHFELVPKSPSEPLLPYTFGVTLSNHRFLTKEHGDNETCSGKGTNLRDATISALGEGVERYSGACFRKDEIHFATYNQIQKTKLHPQKLVLYAPEQYTNLEFAPFDANTSMGWSTAYSLVNESTIEVPSLAVFMNYPTSSPAEYICAVSSSGLAAGSTLLNAILSAALEAIERDAFLITWYNALPCQRVNPLTHPQTDIVDYCKSYMRRGVEMLLYHLPTDFPVHVFMGVGYQSAGDGPSMVVGLGADFDPVKAARSALLEIGQVRPALKQRLRSRETQKRLAELLANPSDVQTLEDHSLLYASNRSVQAFEFLFQRSTESFQWQSSLRNNKEQLQVLVAFLKQKNSDLIYYNLTPPDMERLGLYTARTIIPDLQPIHFGEKNIRLGGSRLYNLPHELGLKQKPALQTELNKNPHPLA